MEASKPMVSVMILCYNYEALLGRALNACAAQTFKDFEIVMINNGSTDNTEGVYKQFCQEHPEIRTTYVFVNPNQGPCHGWNEGLKLAKGEYVMFHDADDWMDPECLEKLVERAITTNADRVTGPFREMSSNGRVIRERKATQAKVRIPSTMLQGTIFRRSVIVENGLFFPISEEFRHWYDVWMVFHFASVECNKGACIPEVLYNYLWYQESDSGTLLAKHEKEQLSVCHSVILNLVQSKEQTMDISLQNEMVYTELRTMYSQLLSFAKHKSLKQFLYLYRGVHAMMMKELPGYLDNPLLWPFGNGYELISGMAIYILSLIEKLRCPGMIWIIAQMAKITKLVK